MDAACKVKDRSFKVALAPQTIPPRAILAFEATIYAAVSRPLANSGAAICPAIQSSEAATVQATPGEVSIPGEAVHHPTLGSSYLVEHLQHVLVGVAVVDHQRAVVRLR